MSCGYFKTINGKKYGPYFRKKTPSRKWDVKSITRVMMKARSEGTVTDAELLHAWAQSTNNKSILCTIAHIMNIQSIGVMILVLASIISGFLTFIKGLKILVSGKKSSIATSVLELIVPKKYWEELGIYLTVIGAFQVVGSSTVYFLRNFVSDKALKALITAACSNEMYDIPIYNPRPGLTNTEEYLEQLLAIEQVTIDSSIVDEYPDLWTQNILNFGEPTPLMLYLEELEKKGQLKTIIEEKQKIIDAYKNDEVQPPIL